MAVRETKEVVKTERPRYLAPFEEIERWFDEAWKRPFSMLRSSMWPQLGSVEEFETNLPHVDIYDDGKELVMKADLPGMRKEDVDISLSDGVLTISGEKKKVEKVEKEKYFRYERSHGSFFRRFELPYDIDMEKIEAHMEDGVLEVRLPRTEEARTRSRKISISG
ncbi:MAG: Hsp20/alpha crystallin family protein [Candidatus Sulfobium sp.]|jgi:HSP20 family protein